MIFAQHCALELGKQQESEMKPVLAKEKLTTICDVTTS